MRLIATVLVVVGFVVAPTLPLMPEAPLASSSETRAPAGSGLRTIVSIVGEDVHINGRPTNRGSRAEGLLLNARMVQAMFDDANASTVKWWAYNDTGVWNATRNVEEFVAAVPSYAEYGLNAVTVGMQGGSACEPDRPAKVQCNGSHEARFWPTVSAFRSDGSLDNAWIWRLEKILAATDRVGMVTILNLFYYSQVVRLRDDMAIRTAIKNVMLFLLRTGYRNVIIDLANEYTCKPYPDLLKADPQVGDTILWVRSLSNGTIPVATNPCGMPTYSVLAAADIVLTEPPATSGNALRTFYASIRNNSGWKAHRVPIAAIECGTAPQALELSIESHCGWGVSDVAGFQSPPVDWRIESSSTKTRVFDAIKAATTPVSVR